MSGKICSRCKVSTAVMVARKEDFCASCFVKFIRGKQRKQMMSDKFKVKYGNKESVVTKVLLCLSLGISSLSLLDMIVSSFKEQSEMHRGRQGFELVCLVVTDKDQAPVFEESIKNLTAAYQLKDLKVDFKLLDIDSYIHDNSSLQKVKGYNDFNVFATDINSSDGSTLTVDDLLSRCDQRTTREDLLEIIHYDLFLRTAQKEGCDTLLLGHSMTKLAKDVISLTVKGRGSMINERLTDGLIPGQNIEVIHPLRDILETEIEKYAEFTEVDKYKVDNTVDNSKKMTRYKTVNEITRGYFEDLDKDYSEVISTVVKIGTKLTKPDSTMQKSCRICGEQIYKDPKSWLTNITVNEGAPVVTEEERKFVELYNDRKAAEDEQVGTIVDVCYGCMVSLGEVKTGLFWPKRDEETLNEYILTDTEE